MITKLDNPPGVLGFDIKGTIASDDIDFVHESLIKEFEQHDKVSFYCEMLDDFDIGASAAWHDFKRAPEMLGNFRKFGRVAFVAKPSWLRAIAKLEQAVLTLFNFDMHVFDPSERERALAWVRGELDTPDTPSIRELPSDDEDIAIFELDGKMHKSDMDVAKGIMIQFLDERKPRNLMAVIKHFGGFELGILADKELITLKLEAAKHLDRYAIVGAPDWLEGYVETMDALLKPELRAFDADEQDKALAWLKAS